MKSKSFGSKVVQKIYSTYSIAAISFAAAQHESKARVQVLRENNFWGIANQAAHVKKKSQKSSLFSLKNGPITPSRHSRQRKKYPPTQCIGVGGSLTFWFNNGGLRYIYIYLNMSVGVGRSAKECEKIV